MHNIFFCKDFFVYAKQLKMNVNLDPLNKLQLNNVLCNFQIKFIILTLFLNK